MPSFLVLRDGERFREGAPRRITDRHVGEYPLRRHEFDALADPGSNPGAIWIAEDGSSEAGAKIQPGLWKMASLEAVAKMMAF